MPTAPAETMRANALPPSFDPLASFEEELRRFDAVRGGANDPLTPSIAAHPGDVAPVVVDGAPYAAPVHDRHETDQNPYDRLGYEKPLEEPAPYAAAEAARREPDFRQDHDFRREEDGYRPASAPAEEAQWYQPAPPRQAALQPEFEPDYPQASAAEASLNAAEDRLATEAAAAAALAQAAGQNRRSKGIFLALGGVAVAGLAVIGGIFAFGGSKKGGASSVPTIAAKTAPTKERPADPGGMEIPNQNKQVMAPRNMPETKPAAIVNNTEQPLDLNQVAKKNEGVRVIAPSPFQAGGDNAAPNAAPPNATAPGVQPGVEARRVTSIRIPVGNESAASPVAPSAAIPSVPPSGAVPRPATPSVTVPPAMAARPAPPTPPAAPVAAPTPPRAVPSQPPKSEVRPESPATTPPKVANTPKAAAPKAAAPKANAPLSLDPNAQAGRNTAPRSSTGGNGTYAIQLASRPDEASARTASTQLKAKYSSAIGGRTPGVVSGEANGKAVYRVRVGGYSQQDAVAACAKVKAAGGGCFVTKQ